MRPVAWCVRQGHVSMRQAPGPHACSAVDAYYAGSSSSLSIPDVRIPLLVIQVGLGGGCGAGRSCWAADDAAVATSCCYSPLATTITICNKLPCPAVPAVPAVQAADDPIAPKEAIPFEALQANPQCLLVVTPTGGHLGWSGGPDGVTGACSPGEPRSAASCTDRVGAASAQPGLPAAASSWCSRCWAVGFRPPAAEQLPFAPLCLRAPRAGAPWTDAAVAEYFTAARQLLAQPEFAAAAAARPAQPAPGEPAGVWTMEETTHQAP